MEHQRLAKRLKLVILGMAASGLIVYAAVIPAFGRELAAAYPEFNNRYWPWLAFIWLTGLPCYGALALGWKIAANIGRDRSFTRENARCLRRIAWLAAADACAVFAGNLAFLLAGLSHPGVMLMSLIVVFAGIAVAVIASALSRLAENAAALQEQSDLTI